VADKPSEEQQDLNIQGIVEKIRDRFAEVEKIIAEMQSRLKKEN